MKYVGLRTYQHPCTMQDVTNPVFILSFNCMDDSSVLLDPLLCFFISHMIVQIIYRFKIKILSFSLSYTEWVKSRYTVHYILYTVYLLLAHLVYQAILIKEGNAWSP